MENDIALYATTYVAFRVAIIAAFAYLFYRILRRKTLVVTARAQSSPADRDGDCLVLNAVRPQLPSNKAQEN
jgi:hypothetical protein